MAVASRARIKRAREKLSPLSPRKARLLASQCQLHFFAGNLILKKTKKGEKRWQFEKLHVYLQIKTETDEKNDIYRTGKRHFPESYQRLSSH
jgi:hypothetical protein